MSTILIISPERWDGQFVSKHHYAVELARRGNDVLYYGPPNDARSMRLEKFEIDGVRLRVVHAGRVARGLRYFPASIRRLIEAHWLRQLEGLLGREIDVIWLFENSRFFDMRFAGNRLKIYQQVDLNQDFNPLTAAATADLTIAVSAPIVRRLRSASRNLLRLNHGWSSLGGMSTNLEHADKDSRFIGHRVHAMLTGNLDIAYLDVSLLAQLVTENSEVCFHFVGKYTPNRRLHLALGSADNVVFWGRQSPEYLPFLLAQADVLLVAYLADEHLEQLANPHKIMEYLASGRVVLATRTLEYEERSGLIEIACNHQEFLSRFQEIVSDLDFWNSAEKIRIRQEFARENAYSRQIDRIVDALGERGRRLLAGDCG